MESDLYDWNPGARMLLLVLALGTRTSLEAHFPEDCPFTKEECIGWCDQAQWRLMLRVGKSECQIHKDILMFEKGGVIEIRRWRDSNKCNHDMYKINVDVVNQHQRPKQKPDVERPPRYKTKNSNRGRFTSENQPNRVDAKELLGAEEVMDEVEEL